MAPAGAGAGAEEVEVGAEEEEEAVVVAEAAWGAGPAVVEARHKEAEAFRERIQSCAEASNIFKAAQNSTIRDTVIKTSADIPPTPVPPPSPYCPTPVPSQPARPYPQPGVAPPGTTPPGEAPPTEPPGAVQPDMLEVEAVPPPPRREKPKPVPKQRSGPSELEQLEGQIAAREAAVAELERRLSDDWSDVDMLDAHRRARDELQGLLSRWERLFEEAQRA